MSVNQVFAAGGVPSIPATRATTMTNQHESLLFWVYTGRATMRIDGRDRDLSAGEALWVPAGIPYQIRVAPESVAFPIMLSRLHLPASSNRALHLVVPPSWSDWLIFQFAHNLGYFRGTANAGAGLLELINGAQAGEYPEGSVARRQLFPPLPRSAEALEVARLLLHSPADDRALPAFAEQVLIGMRTLQRQFSQETGLPFSRWRTAVRVAAAASHLDNDRAVGWTGRQVGFATPAGFTRAFQEHAGSTPQEYRRSRTSTLQTSLTSESRSAVTQGVVLPSVNEPKSSGLVPPKIPATATWTRVSDFHVVVWVYRGRAKVTHGGRSWQLRRGDVLRLPAGVRNNIEISPGSLLLPLGSQPGMFPGPDLSQRVLHINCEAEVFLLHTMVANYSLVRPEIHDNNQLANFILAVESDTAVPLGREPGSVDAVQRILSAVHADPASRGSLVDWGDQLGLTPSELHRGFMAATGQSYPQWRAQLRMTLARDFLQDGRSVGEIARKLGYAHASGFTKVFHAAHHMSPREYQRSGWRGTTEELINS